MSTITCPLCQQDYEIEDAILGRKVECVCGHKFIATSLPVSETIPVSSGRANPPEQHPVQTTRSKPSSPKKKRVQSPSPPPPGPYDTIFDKYPKLLKVKFGQDAPTMKQFAYAYSLGVNVNKLTFSSISKAIDKELAKPLEKRKPNFLDWDDADELYDEIYNRSPADQDQMKELAEYNFKCNRRPTRQEAEEIIDKFGNTTIVCPACNETIEVGLIFDKRCPWCDAKFAEVYVPIFLPEEK